MAMGIAAVNLTLIEVDSRSIHRIYGKKPSIEPYKSRHTFTINSEVLVAVLMESVEQEVVDIAVGLEYVRGRVPPQH